jgi:hypothetical protein
MLSDLGIETKNYCGNPEASSVAFIIENKTAEFMRDNG